MRHIIKKLGQMHMAEVNPEDMRQALVPVAEKSASVYKSVVLLYQVIFRSAAVSRVITEDPAKYIRVKEGGRPREDKPALTDEQAERLLATVRGLPPYVFVMLGLYVGLRRERSWRCNGTASTWTGRLPICR